MPGVLNISEAASLALHTAALLAAEPEKTQRTRDLARTLDASEAHLAKVLQRLGRAGIVDARRGPGGGYLLARAPERITLMEVYEAIEGPWNPPVCLMGRPDCSGPCILGGLLSQVGRAAGDYFTGTRLSDISLPPAREARHG